MKIKNPKDHPKIPLSWNMVFSDGFWDKVSLKKWYSDFGHLGPGKRSVSGHQREKPNQRLRRHRNFGRSNRWNFMDWFTNVFLRKSVFTPVSMYQPAPKQAGWSKGTEGPFGTFRSLGPAGAQRQRHLENTLKERPKKLVSFETFDHSDEET